ncbi:hypothetical protein ABFB09_01750 [Dehalogenimonas sp. THU2]|uniref:hypothetical protein n=1 Tax=Dehalogenimonas sp. THU2 TaxID=3151121 RepID=UPI003218772A
MALCTTDTYFRNWMLLDHSRSYPDLTCRELGEQFGLSPQRVSQLLRIHSCKQLIQRRNQLLLRYHEKHIISGDGVQGELFALTRGKDYYRIQQGIRNCTCVVCPTKTLPSIPDSSAGNFTEQTKEVEDV